MPTLNFNEEAYNCLVKKREELKNKYHIRSTLADIASFAILEGINGIEKHFGIGVIEKKEEIKNENNNMERDHKEKDFDLKF